MEFSQEVQDSRQLLAALTGLDEKFQALLNDPRVLAIQSPTERGMVLLHNAFSMGWGERSGFNSLDTIWKLAPAINECLRALADLPLESSVYAEVLAARNALASILGESREAATTHFRGLLFSNYGREVCRLVTKETFDQQDAVELGYYLSSAEPSLYYGYSLNYNDARLTCKCPFHVAQTVRFSEVENAKPELDARVQRECGGRHAASIALATWFRDYIGEQQKVIDSRGAERLDPQRDEESLSHFLDYVRLKDE